MALTWLALDLAMNIICQTTQNRMIYNLEEFAAQYHLDDTFGAYAAHLDVSAGAEFIAMIEQHTLFSKLLLVTAGGCSITAIDTSNPTNLYHGDMLLVPADVKCRVDTVTYDFKGECVLVDEQFAAQLTHYNLTNEKYKGIQDIFHFIRDIIRHRHINKSELIRSMFNVLKLAVGELPYEQCTISHDLGHKKELYEIFLHHLYRNFRKERQIHFYADKLNVSVAYLSRTVREISGSTVNDHVTSLVYKEICNMLSNSDMTVGEIATNLNFSDQSALTNFFKQRSGITPVAYRHRQLNA